MRVGLMSVYSVHRSKVDDFFFFRLSKSILFVVNSISLDFFPFLIKYYHIMLVIIVFRLCLDMLV